MRHQRQHKAVQFSHRAHPRRGSTYARDRALPASSPRVCETAGTASRSPASHDGASRGGTGPRWASMRCPAPDGTRTPPRLQTHRLADQSRPELYYQSIAMLGQRLNAGRPGLAGARRPHARQRCRATMEVATMEGELGWPTGGSGWVNRNGAWRARGAAPSGSIGAP